MKKAVLRWFRWNHESGKIEDQSAAFSSGGFDKTVDDNIAKFRAVIDAERVELFKLQVEASQMRAHAAAAQAMRAAALMRSVAAAGIVSSASALYLAQQPGLSREAMPDPAQPSALGWRMWRWSKIATHAVTSIDGNLAMTDHISKWQEQNVRYRLTSPHYRHIWDSPELRVEKWDDSAALRGVAGIHARRMPYDWRAADWPEIGHQEGTKDGHRKIVTGIVERFGRYVLGDKGWRAEWCIIRELQAPDIETMVGLMEVYPEVKVHLKGK